LFKKGGEYSFALAFVVGPSAFDLVSFTSMQRKHVTCTLSSINACNWVIAITIACLAGEQERQEEQEKLASL